MPPKVPYSIYEGNNDIYILYYTICVYTLYYIIYVLFIIINIIYTNILYVYIHIIYEGNTLARVFNMIMLVWSKEGKAYTTDEVTNLLEKTGFGQVNNIFYCIYVINVYVVLYWIYVC